MPKASGITATLIEIFVKHPGETLFVNDIAQDTGFDRKQIQGCITNNIYRKTYEVFNDVHIIAPGNAWSYRPNTNKETKPEKRVFEEIGETKSGALVIQDSEGSLWRAIQLD